MRKNQILSWIKSQIILEKWELLLVRGQKRKSRIKSIKIARRRTALTTYIKVWEKVSGKKWPK